MKAKDIVDVLARDVPKYTSGFSNAVEITSIVSDQTTVTVTTASAHGMVDGQRTAILGAESPVQIASITRVTTFATVITVQDHDLTLSERDKRNGGKTVTIRGSTETQFNGTFALLEVTNRRKIIIEVEDSGSTTVSNTPILENANQNIFNGLFSISNVTDTTFEYTIAQSYPLPASGNPVAQTEIRVLSVLDINQYLLDIYTKQVAGDDQLIVVLGDATRNKNKNEQSDASDSTSGEYSYTPTFIQSFAVYIVQNMTNILGGASARDKVESVYVPAIFKTLERGKLDTGFSYSQHRSTCTGHGVFAFDAQESQGKALYVHEIAFEQLAVLDKCGDTVLPDPNVAMRNVDYTINSRLGEGILLADVDLDKEPIK